jgi:hypothetical protein
MERRHKPAVRNPRSGIKNNAAGNNPAGDPFCLPNIAELIEDGEITVGLLHPVGCVATASDEHNSLAMLVRRQGETLAQLLTRLDQAIAKARSQDIFTDEINPPPVSSNRR